MPHKDKITNNHYLSRQTERKIKVKHWVNMQGQKPYKCVNKDTENAIFLKKECNIRIITYSGQRGS